MSIFLSTLLVFGIAAIILWPSHGTRFTEANTYASAANVIKRLRRARDRVYEEIRMLQQERFMRDLNEAEYQEHLGELRLAAAELVREQEQVLETLAAIDARLEEEMKRTSEGNNR